jgi:dTDP-glucose 4,6-dehydratase
MRVLITGGAGFIGHHLVQHIIKTTNWQIIIFDKLNYASNGLERLKEIGAMNSRRVSYFSVDISQPISDGVRKEVGQFDIIFHLAAESHVEKSIANPEPFIISNVLGTMRMLDFANCQEKLDKFIYFSTDEVFGPAKSGIFFSEWDRYNSSNPYSASKAGAEELCLAWHNTYGTPIVISHCMNCFGERQYPEKFIPMCIKKILHGEKIVIHSNPTKTKSGSRFYIHARNVSTAVLFLVEKAEIGQKYNIVGEREVGNLTMAQFIADILEKKLNYEMVDFHSDRPGHDLRYALDGKKMAEMGWVLPVSFETSLKKTIRWTVENPKWLET